MSIRTILAASLSAGVAFVVASPAAAAGQPPTVPSDAAIAQYIEAVPSATGAVPVGGRAAKASPLPRAVRAKVERTAGADASALLDIAQDPRFGARPVASAGSQTAAPPTHTHRPLPRGHARARTAHTVPRQPALSTATPGPLAAAASTAGSGSLLVVAVLLIAITAAGLAARVQRR
jgi:hypothetical protein